MIFKDNKISDVDLARYLRILKAFDQPISLCAADVLPAISVFFGIARTQSSTNGDVPVYKRGIRMYHIMSGDRCIVMSAAQLTEAYGEAR